MGNTPIQEPQDIFISNGAISELDLSSVDEETANGSNTASFRTSEEQNDKTAELAAGYLADMETATEDESALPVLPVYSSCGHMWIPFRASIAPRTRSEVSTNH